MRLFVVASAAILIAAAFLLGSMLTRTLRSQALGEERTSLAQYVDGVLGPIVVHGNRVVTTRWLSQTILRALRGQPDVISVKVWRADGTLAWASLDASRIGHRFALDSDLGKAIRGNRAVASVISPKAEARTPPRPASASASSCRCTPRSRAPTTPGRSAPTRSTLTRRRCSASSGRASA